MLATIIAIITLFILDTLWILTMKTRYKGWVYAVQGKTLKVRASGAIISYILLALFLVLIVFPAAKNDKTHSAKVIKALKWGTVSGFAIYGIFNATNYAMFSGYQWQMALIDTLWGGTLFGIVTWIYLISAQ